MNDFTPAPIKPCVTLADLERIDLRKAVPSGTRTG